MRNFKLTIDSLEYIFIIVFQIVGVQQYVVRPPEGEDAVVTPPVVIGGPPSGLLSQDIQEASALSDDLVRRGQPLPMVIVQVG